MLFFRVLTAFYSAILFFPSIAIAEIIPITPLNFGTVVISSNKTPSAISLNHDGSSPIYSNNIYPLTKPNRAEYHLIGFPPNITLFINPSVTMADSASQSPSLGGFRLVSISSPAQVTSNNNGSATLYIGGEIETNNQGQYSDTVFNMNFRISVNY